MKKYSGYTLTQRSKVLSQLNSLGIPPLFERVVLEHITFKFPDSLQAPRVTKVEVFGWASDSRIQALVVKVDSQPLRLDGRPYHITYSLEASARPVESNDMLLSKISQGGIIEIEPFVIEVKEF